MTRYKKTMAEAIAEVWANDIQLDEGRMKTIATMFAGGSSAEEIAKKMKLPLSTVKSILGEEDLPESMLWEFTDAQIQKLKKEYSGLKGARISLARANQLRNIFDKITNSQLPKLYKADIPFLSSMAASRMIQKGIQIPKGIKLSTFENKSWEEITETHTSDQSSKNIQKDKNKQENAPSEADIDRLKKQGLKPTKEAKFDFIKLRNGTKVLDKVYPNMTQARNAASGLMQLHKGTKADGYQSPFNNRFYVRIREENELKEYAEYIEYMCKNSSQAKQVANMFKGKVGSGELSASGSEVRVDSAKDVENIHKQVVAKFGDDVRVITKEENLEENANVMKGVDDYIKIGQDKIKNHPSFKALYTKQKRDYMKSVGPKYIKIHDTENGQKRSIHAFIDKQTGDLFKPAGVNAPAKGVRGNVTDKDFMNKLKSRFDTHGGHLYARDPYKRIFGSMHEEDQSSEVEKLKKELEKSREQNVALKQKAQLDATKQAQRSRSAQDKMVNPETGEPLLQIGIAYKHLKKKMEQEKQEKEQKERSKKIKKLGKPDTFKQEGEMTESAASDKAKAMGLDYMRFGRYGKDGKVTHKTSGDSLVAVGKSDEPKSDTPAPKKPEAPKKDTDDTSKEVNPAQKSELAKALDDFDYDNEDSLMDAIDYARENGMSELADELEVVSAGVADDDEKNELQAQIQDIKAKLTGKPVKCLEFAKKADEIQDLMIDTADGETYENDISTFQADFLNAMEVYKQMVDTDETEGSAGSGNSNSSKGFRPEVLDVLSNMSEFDMMISNIKDAQEDEKVGEILDEIMMELEFVSDENADHDGYTKSHKVNSTMDSIVDLTKQLGKLVVKKEEADLTKKQIKMVHKVADDLPKKSFRDRYGKKKGDSVRYGTATNMVKKKMKVENSKHPAKAMYETIKAVKNKAEKTGMPYSILKKVYDRGMAAWKGGHRPGATQQQWALARVNSFVTKSSGTWGGADKDLAKKVRGSK